MALRGFKVIEVCFQVHHTIPYTKVEAAVRWSCSRTICRSRLGWSRRVSHSCWPTFFLFHRCPMAREALSSYQFQGSKRTRCFETYNLKFRCVDWPFSSWSSWETRARTWRVFGTQRAQRKAGLCENNRVMTITMSSSWGLNILF